VDWNSKFTQKIQLKCHPRATLLSSVSNHTLHNWPVTSTRTTRSTRKISKLSSYFTILRFKTCNKSSLSHKMIITWWKMIFLPPGIFSITRKNNWLISKLDSHKLHRKIKLSEKSSSMKGIKLIFFMKKWNPQKNNSEKILIDIRPQ
jgi:hypothetical protein